MIARIWRGKTLEKDADEYYDYLLETGLKEYRNTEGNKLVAWPLTYYMTAISQ